MTDGRITLQQADQLADAALARGREIECLPLTVAVLDPGGHPVVVKREDGSGILRAEIATGKAWGALGMGLDSRELARRAEDRGPFFTALAAVSGGRLVPVPGGVLLRRAGDVIGAVGISGDTSERDEDCARAGIRAVGLEAV